MLKYADIGSVSHGTLRDEDLFTAFHDELEWQLRRQERTPENRDELDKLQAVYDELSEEFYDADGNLIDSPELSMAINEDLMDALQQFAAPYCYFGAHPGDGADFGYWFSADAIEDLPKYSSHEEADEDRHSNPSEFRGDYCIVNDHGNVTIYSDSREIIGEYV